MKTEKILEKFRSLSDVPSGGGRTAPLVYICAPYDGDMMKYFLTVQDYCWTALRSGCVPVVPFLMYSPVITAYDAKAEPLERICANRVLAACDELWIFEGEKLTSGMADEINLATCCDIPVCFKHMIYE